MTGRYVCLLVGLLLWHTTAQAELDALPRSLFLTPDEMTAQPGVTRGSTRLDALVYYGPGNWTLWLNGQEITPSTIMPRYAVINVNATHVTLREQLGDQSRIYSLAPSQSYDWASRTVSGQP